MRRQPDDGPLIDELALNPKFRESEGSLLRALLQATDYGVLVSGLDRQDIVANRRMGEIFSCAPEEVVQADPEAVRRHAQARVQDPRQFEETLARTYADPFRTFQDELVLATDPPRTLRRFTGPVLDRAGEPLGRLWTFLDITDHKRLQAEVERQLEERTRDFEVTREILQAMNDVCRLATANQSGGELQVSVVTRLRRLRCVQCAALLLCEEEGQLHGTLALPDGRIETLRVPLQAESTLAEFQSSAQTSGQDSGSPPCPCSGAVAALLNCEDPFLLPLRGDEGVFGFLALALEPVAGDPPSISMYRIEQLAALADQTAQTLESHRLQARLREALQSLKAAQKRMVEIEKLHTAGALAASVAHDIRNILATFQMELDLIPGSVHTLREQISRFSALTHRLLAYARPGALDLRPRYVPQVIERVLPLLLPQAEVNRVQILLEFPADLPLVSADEHQLEHLFVNLCLNAIQAMAETGGTLTLSAAIEENWVAITVKDSGPGIAAEALPRLFDPFFTTRATGFGLGLFSCKRIVEEHGGCIDAASTPGQGACFTIRLMSLPLSRP